MNPLSEYTNYGHRPAVHCVTCGVVCSHAFVETGGQQFCYQCWQIKQTMPPFGTSVVGSLGYKEAQQKANAAAARICESIKAVGGMKPEHFLQSALKALVDRGVQRDSPGGERSMALAVAIFNSWRGKDLSESDGWRFMIALKQARSVQGGFTEDDYTDLAGYAALLGECEAEKREKK